MFLSSRSLATQDFQAYDVYENDSKLAFLVRTFTDFHRAFARDKQTPWLHRGLYKDNMPPSILQAFTTSVMYASRTDANKSWV